MGRAWPQPGEALFLDSDVDDVLEYLDMEDAQCPCGCDQPKALSFDTRTEGHWDVDVIRCHAGAARHRRSGDFGANEQGGLFFVVRHDGQFD